MWPTSKPIMRPGMQQMSGVGAQGPPLPGAHTDTLHLPVAAGRGGSLDVDAAGPGQHDVLDVHDHRVSLHDARRTERLLDLAVHLDVASRCCTDGLQRRKRMMPSHQVVQYNKNSSWQCTDRLLDLLSPGPAGLCT